MYNLISEQSLSSNPPQTELTLARKDRGKRVRIYSKSSVLLHLTTPSLVPLPSDKRRHVGALLHFDTRLRECASVGLRPGQVLASSLPRPTAKTDCAIRIAGWSDLCARLIYMYCVLLDNGVLFVHSICMPHCFSVANKTNTFSLRNETSLFMQPKRR